MGTKVVKLGQDKDQRLWVKFKIGKYQAIENGRISKHPITLQKIKNLFENSHIDSNLAQTYRSVLRKIPNLRIRHIGITNSKKLFLIDENRPTVYMIDVQSRKITNLKNILKLESAPTFLLIDKESNVWVATDGGGIYCIYDAPFVNFTASSGLSNSFVHDIVEDANGRILAGTKNGMYVLENGRWQNVYFPVHVEYNKLQVWQFAKNRDKRLYMNTSIQV